MTDGAQRIRHRTTLTGHKEAVTAVRFSPNGKHVASASGDKTVKIWRIEDSVLEATLGENGGHQLGVSDVAWSHDGLLLASGSDDRTVKVWERATGTLKQNLTGHSNFVLSVDFHPKTYEIVSGSYDTKILQWDAEKGKCIKIIMKHTAPVASVRYNKDGRFLLSTSYDGSCKVWNAETGDFIKEIARGQVPITCGSWSGAGCKWALINTLNSTLHLWALELEGDASKTTRCVRTFKNHQNARYALFSVAVLTAKIVVSASEDGSLYIWEIQSAALVQKLTAHKGVMLGLDAHGSSLATSGLEDNCIKIWELASD